MVIKPLDAALADNDHIYAVVRFLLDRSWTLVT
jgi:acyl transferase domain-containing protein